MDPNRLWAKSKREDELEYPSMFLPGHLADVHEAARRVLDATSDDQLRALGLLPGDYSERVRRIVLLASAVHDLGKANDHFQGMIRRSKDRQDKQQGLRHEWATVLMLNPLREWLLTAVGVSDVDFALMEWAVAGHHPAHDHASPPKSCPPGAGSELILHMGHSDFKAALQWLREAFQLSAPPSVAETKRNLTGAESVFTEIAVWAKAARRTWDSMNDGDKRLVAAVKDSLVAADIAGSALPKKLPDDPQRWVWISESFAEKPKPGELQAVVSERSKSFTDRNEDRERFQSAVANSSTAVTYVKAGCGTGKTLAAYMWAAKNHPTRRLYFCYPTTGTATEGFKDYLYEPDVKADLFHSRREVDFEIILNSGADQKNPDADDAIRIDSLDAWSTPIVACTVDTVLGIVQNNKRGLFAWPALAQAAFVFDEVHAYDDRLFGALLRFLRDLPGLPSLLMTASLPNAREEALRALLKGYRGIDLSAIGGPTELEELARYKKVALETNDPLPIVRRTLESGAKVLWVCNTVARVMDAANRVEAMSLTPLLYHSRYKYEDRVRRHKAVIDAFDPKKNSRSALAICSQVAEMSLDLSADLLVTDLATVPALIQRLGRLNRRAKSGDPTKPFMVVEPEKPLPYTAADLNATRTWLAKLAKDCLSQKHLAQAWEQTGDRPPELVGSAWLDGGPKTEVTELRQASPGITVLMEEDLRRVKANRKDLGKLVLPMMPTDGWQRWDRERGIPVAPSGSIRYDRMRGAEWNA
jgi:CRISPR-associated endonuclease/helicase Cas3